MPIPQVSSVEQPSYTDDSVAMNDEYEYYDEGTTDHKTAAENHTIYTKNQITYLYFLVFLALKKTTPTLFKNWPKKVSILRAKQATFISLFNQNPEFAVKKILHDFFRNECSSIRSPKWDFLCNFQTLCFSS